MGMPTALASALSSYLAAVQTEFENGRTEANPQGRKSKLILSEDELLLRLVAHVEQTNQFSELVRATAQAFQKDEFHGSIGGLWEGHAQNYFRLSGFYVSLFKRETPRVSDVIDQYSAAFNAETNMMLRLAPLEFVQFGEESLDFGDFQIRRYSYDELDAILRNPAKKIFYKWAYADPRQLAGYWFLSVEERVAAKDGRLSDLVFEDRISVSYSPHPGVVQRALTHLALFNWRVRPSDRPDRPLLVVTRPFNIGCPALDGNRPI